MPRLPPRSPLFPYTTLFRSIAKSEPDNLVTKLRAQEADLQMQLAQASVQLGPTHPKIRELSNQLAQTRKSIRDRKSTRLNSSHVAISYAVFCLTKKTV